MSDIRDRAREKIAKLLYSELCEEYGWEDRWEDVRDKTKEQYLEDADKFFANPEIAVVDRAMLKDDIENLVSYASNNDQMSDEEYQHLAQIKTRMQELGLHNKSK